MAPEPAKQDLTRQGIMARTGHSIGVVRTMFTIAFTMEAGEIFVVMGLSGAGKSTLVHMLNRLVGPRLVAA